MPNTILDEPFITFGSEICGDIDSALRREWLVTNGLGGYASGTVAGVATRSYHGLLVAALQPPVARMVLVGGLVEWATVSGRRIPLSAAEFGDGAIVPNGYVHIRDFRLDGAIPVWTYALGEALVERRIWMKHGANTTYVAYSLSGPTDPIELEITPLVTYRSMHALTSGHGWQPDTESQPFGITIHAQDGATPFHLLSDKARFDPANEWWWNFRYRDETARGLNDHGDLFAPGAFVASLKSGETLTLVLSTEPVPDLDSAGSLTAERTRQSGLLQRAGVEAAPQPVQQLVLAADQFVVNRTSSGGETSDTTPGKTVIAGYHWFNDWGRDTMISLPGLALTTGRPEDAADILRTFAGFVQDGLLPNNFPDQDGAIPGYNTADATLWYVLAIRSYVEFSGDRSLVDELLPTLLEIVERHITGTRYGIGVDSSDWLLRAGEPGVQLTWMDAKVGNWVVTPRIGKPVEINALWYNVLRTLAAFLTERGDPSADRYTEHADSVHASFRNRFFLYDRGYLADVVDGPNGDETTLRPNQIFALSLPYPLLEGDDALKVLRSVGENLLTPYGLRSLTPDDPAYRGDYGGDQVRRDGGYHQGPVWCWLTGAYAEAYGRVTGDHEGVLKLLEPFANHLHDAGLGSISEILAGDAPHLPRGCVAQAWSVAEVLRVWIQALDAKAGESAK